MESDYEGAQGTYEKLREFCRNKDVPLALAQAEYNIAYLHYLRGSYGRAFDMLRKARDLAQRVGDGYHAALCRLDLAELFLEIGLYRDAVEMAEHAFSQFEQQGMKYEAGKALCYWAIALTQQGKGFPAMELFARARAIFIKENNHVWSSLINFHEAVIYFNEGRLMKARQYCLTALDFFRNYPLPSRAIICHLLLARVALKAGEIESAGRECQNALRGIAECKTPILNYQAHLVMGKIEEAGGRVEEARNQYRDAKEALDIVRNNLPGPQLKISFIENKLEVYESLVNLCLGPGLSVDAQTEAWNCMEEAKSRTLLELISRKTNSTGDNAQENPLAPRILKLRERLNWYYHRIEVEELAQTPARAERLHELRRHAAHYEKEFLRLFHDLPSNEAEAAGLGTPKPVPLETVREALGQTTTLIEYFRVRDIVLAAVVTL
ncbi:MAG TPA: tetratricopeptide repeat protein, partial [Candidatus Sulfotelmatobacter sp.]|nr:tetratricopeptide repeat protein [Candidatus Sulfotelmatobacter sp.]